jgi:hypothetical protein
VGKSSPAPDRRKKANAKETNGKGTIAYVDEFEKMPASSSASNVCRVPVTFSETVEPTGHGTDENTNQEDHEKRKPSSPLSRSVCIPLSSYTFDTDAECYLRQANLKIRVSRQPPEREKTCRPLILALRNRH